MKAQFILVIFSMYAGGLFAQIDPQLEAYEKQYQHNIKQSRIDGIYIPKDIDDAIKEIHNLAPAEGLQKFAELQDEMEAAKKLHFGLGRWMTINWNFYDGSRLSHHLKELGVLHPDDMARFMLVILHRQLNNKERNPEPLIQNLAEERKKIAEKLIESKRDL